MVYGMSQSKLNFDFKNKYKSKSAKQYMQVVKNKHLPSHMIEEESKEGHEEEESRNMSCFPQDPTAVTSV